MVRPVIRDGREWLVGSGFPGWPMALAGGIVTAILMGVPTIFLVNARLPSLLLALMVLLTGLFASVGLYRWVSQFWLTCDADGIHVRRSVLWGVINRTRTISLDDVAHVTARLAGAQSKAGALGKTAPKIAHQWWEIQLATKSGKPGSRDLLVMLCADADLAQGLTNLLRQRAGLPVDPNLTQKALAEMESRWKQLSD